jgi:hypothetical protein
MVVMMGGLVREMDRLVAHVDADVGWVVLVLLVLVDGC